MNVFETFTLGKRRDSLILMAIFIVALGIRVANLGQFLTSDEPEAWLGWSIGFIQAIMEGRLGDTFFSFAPGITLMWSGDLGLYLAYLFTSGHSSTFGEFLQTLPFDPIEPSLIFWFRLPNAAIGAICITIAYSYAKALLNRKIALVATALLALDPLLIGMNRVLGHDGLSASFMLVSTLSIISFFTNYSQKPSYRHLVVSAIFAGLAISAKLTAIYLLPFVGLTALVTLLFYKRFNKIGLYLRDGLIWMGVVILTIFILWPALWIHPIEMSQRVLRELNNAAGQPHNRGSFFWGEPVPDPGMWFYWVAAYFRLTAITTIGLILGGVYLFVTDNTEANTKSFNKKLIISLLLSFIVFYIIFLSFGSKKQDRYIVPILPMASLAAAVGYVWLAQKIKHKSWQYALLAGVIGLQGLITFNSAPYYLSHYNLLAGGSKVAQNTLLIGWGEGLDLAANYLNSMPHVENLKVSSWYHSAFEPFFKGQAIETAGEEKISRSAKPALASNYVVLYVNQIQRQMPTPGMIQYYQSFEPEHVVTIDGLDYAFIYPSPAIQHTFSGEVRLVGQAELLGYNLLDKQGQPISELASDSIATLQLYWAWQGKDPDEPIGLNLVDVDGRVWGWGNPLGSNSPIPFESWAEGAIVHDDFTLEILPGTPPGNYYLKVWIDRPATGERVGDFPLPLEEAQFAVIRPATPPSLTDLHLSKQLDLTPFNNIKLLGLDNSEGMAEPWPPNETRDLVLYWQADQLITESHPITLALIDNKGVSRANWTSFPAGGHFPTDQWQPGDIIRDPWSLTLPPYVPPGDYRLTVRMGEASPIDLLMVTVEGRPRLFDSPAVDIPLNVTFGESIELLGVQAPVVDESTIGIVPGQPLEFELIWQATNLVEADYTVTVQLLDEHQQVHAQRDSMPLDGTAPTTSWAIDEIIPDTIRLDIPAEIDSNPSQLLIALYRVETGERLLLPNGADHLTIPVKFQ